MATRKLKPVHPGEILRHDFLEPAGMTPYRLARHLDVSAPTVNDLAEADAKKGGAIRRRIRPASLASRDAA